MSKGGNMSLVIGYDTDHEISVSGMLVYDTANQEWRRLEAEGSGLKVVPSISERVAEFATVTDVEHTSHTEILSYTNTGTTPVRVNRIIVGGDTDANFRVLIDSNAVALIRTSPTDRTKSIDVGNLLLQPNEELSVMVIHYYDEGTVLGDYEASLIGHRS